MKLNGYAYGTNILHVEWSRNYLNYTRMELNKGRPYTPGVKNGEGKVTKNKTIKN